MGIKVLFIYPNTYGMYMIPPAAESDVDLHSKGQINIPLKKDLQNDFKQNSRDEM
jgi:hypothetical protein|tara:strand:- start:348 stop:512 length:165 start_codon:yes stop_codon:yes gene_type:complete